MIWCNSQVPQLLIELCNNDNIETTNLQVKDLLKVTKEFDMDNLSNGTSTSYRNLTPLRT